MRGRETENGDERNRGGEGKMIGARRGRKGRNREGRNEEKR